MHRFTPVSGALALDFVNTVGWRASEAPREGLESPSDLREWAKAVGLGRLAAKVGDGKAETSELEALRSFRESLFRLFVAFSARRRPRPADLAALNRALAEAPERRKLTSAGARFAWIEPHKPANELLIAAVARSAATLLTERAPETIKCCDGEGCGWLFLDTSRNRARRWCSMSDCGNRAKAKRHYARSQR